MHRDSPPDPRLNEGLERLRQLGYLRSPADFFVAEKVTPRGGLWHTAGVAGAWVGLGGGVLAGLLLTVSVLVAVPHLLHRFGELAWLAFDLILASAVGASVLVFLLTALLLSWKRARKVPWRAGAERILLSIAILPPALYLSDVFGRFLLHRVQGESWFLAALGAALVATLLAGIWGRLLRALLAAAGLAPVTGDALQSLRRIRVEIRAMVFFACGLLLLVGPYREMRALPRLDQIPVPDLHQAGEPMLLITVDGIRDRELQEALPELGQAQAIAEESLPEHPTAFWNILVTGFDARVHGLEHASGYAPTGVSSGLEEAMRQPLLAAVLRGVLPGVGLGRLRAHDQRELRRPPFWEIAAHCGIASSIINAWASYPAARHPELSIVSDRCFLRMWEGERVDEDDHLLHPLRPRLLQTAQAALGTRRDHPSVVEGDSLLAVLPFAGLEQFREAWEFAVATDLFHAALARADRATGRYQLVVVHLGGADVLLRSRKHVPAGVSKRLSERLIRLHRRLVEELIAELCLEQDSWFLVSSELSGEFRSAAVFSSPGRSTSAFLSSERNPRGALFLAPVLLWHLGVPPAMDMAAPIPELRLESPGPESWGRRPGWTPTAERSAADLERLRSLGYIGGS